MHSEKLNKTAEIANEPRRCCCEPEPPHPRSKAQEPETEAPEPSESCCSTPEDAA